MPSKNLKGYAFEWFVRRILNDCGFPPVVPDGKMVFRNGRNVMVHGLGQPHNNVDQREAAVQLKKGCLKRIAIYTKDPAGSVGISILTLSSLFIRHALHEYQQ